MAIVVEDGTGVAGAEGLASVSYVDTYWLARTHRTYATTWAALTTAVKEGCIREATTFLNGMDADFRGVRRGFVQGCVFPRTGALDDAGYPLPALPDVIKAAVAELAVRASAAELEADQGRLTASETVGPLSVSYEPGQAREKYYRAVESILRPVLKASGAWAWL